MFRGVPPWSSAAVFRRCSAMVFPENVSGKDHCFRAYHVKCVQGNYPESRLKHISEDYHSHFFACDKCQTDNFPKLHVTVNGYQILQNKYKQEIVKRDAANIELNKINAELRTARSKAESTIASRDRDISRIKDDCQRQLQNYVNLTDHKNKIAVYEGALADAQKQIDKCNETISNGENAIALLQTDLDALQNLYQTTQQKLNTDLNATSGKRKRPDSAMDIEESNFICDVINKEAEKTNAKVDAFLSKFVKYATTPVIIDDTALNAQIKSISENVSGKCDEIKTSINAISTRTPVANVTPIITKTYARVLKESLVTPAQIRIITLKGSEAERTAFLATLRNGDALKGNHITSVIVKGNISITCKFTDENEASKFEASMNTAYNNHLLCKKVIQRPFEIKVVRMLTADMTQDTVFAQLKNENIVLRDAEVNLVCMFKITTDRLTYSNMIISTTSLETHDSILSGVSLNFNNSKCRVFEIVNTLQCLKCMRFGQFSTGCPNTITCRICASDHDYKSCANQDKPPSCSNCLLSNQTGTDHNTRHRATDDRCPIKVARINTIKVSLTPKN